MESFGARLKREREKKGITLDDISLSTKIGTRLLRALEEEHFDQLPGGIFNKGFVRAYARHLGLDEDQAVADYLAASGASVSEKIPEAPVADEPEKPIKAPPSGVERIPWEVLAGALLVVAFGFAIWGFKSREKQRELQEVPASHPTAAASVPAISPNSPSTATANEPVAAPIAPTTQTPDAAAAPTPVASSGFVVKIKAQNDSWLSITADGQTIMEGTLAAGGEKSILAKKSIALRAGNAGALDFYFNGNKLPPQGEEGQVKALTFNENGIESPKPASEPASPPQ